MRSVRKVEPFIEIIFDEDRDGFFSNAEARAYADELSGFADEIRRKADTLTTSAAEMDIDWYTIETEMDCNWGNRMDAPQFIPAGSHYDAGDSLGPMGQIIGRAGNWPKRRKEVDHARFCNR